MLTENRALIDALTVNVAPRPLRVHWILLITIAWLFGPSTKTAKGQTYLNGVGVPTYTTKVPIENGFIDASTGRIHLEIPVGKFPQRAGRQFNASLMYDSNIWSLGYVGWQPVNVSTSNGAANSWSGWRLVTSGDSGYVWSAGLPLGACTYYIFNWYEPNGTNHQFDFNPFPESGSGACNIPTGNGLANDGTGYTISVSNYNQAKVYAPDGTQVYPTVEDPNGNYYSVSSGNVVDTLGRTPVTTTVNGNTITYAVLNAVGGTSTYTVTTESIPVNTNFGQSGFTEYSGNITTVQSILMPDGTSYSFTYDSGSSAGHYGLLKSMTLPTGGTISYTWSIFTDANSNKYTWISSRTTPDSSTPWTYTPTAITTCSSGQVDCKQTFQIAKPSGDNTVYTFILNGGAWSGEVQHYTGSVSSANLTATVNQCFSFVTVSGGSCSYNVTTTTPAAFVLKTINSTLLPVPGGSNIATTTAYTWSSDTYAGYTGGSFGNITKIQEWNFGSSLSGSANRITNISYLNGSSYISAHIVNRPTSVTRTNGSGGTVAQTNYCYDYTGGCGGSSFANVSGVTQHDSTFGTSYTTRGDATQVQQLISGTSNYLTTSEMFDITGQVASSKDSNGNLTTYTYSSTYENAYPTTIENALSQSRTLAYNFNTGLLTSVTDPNSQTASFTYDNMGRPLTSNYPDGGQASIGQNFSGSTYTGATGTQKINSSQNMVSTGNVDELGRAASQVLSSDPSGQDTIAYTYDSNGRTKTASNPYRSTSDSTYGLETYTYDGLDRTTQVTNPDSSIAYTFYGAAVGSNGGRSSQVCSGYGVGYPVLNKDEAGKLRQNWTDAFGRLIEVDEPDPSTGSLTSGAYVNTCYSYDLNNNLTGAVTQGSRTRSFTYDMLSRPTATTTPESGTTNYYYTSGGSLCAGDISAICSLTDARSVATSYVYDALNRPTAIYYSGSTGTQNVYFYYDTMPFGLSGSNLVGRLSGEWAGINTPGQWATWRGFSYDPMGRVATQWDCLLLTSGCGNVAETQASYDLAGDLVQLTYPSGRVVTSQYNNALQPTQVTLASFSGTSVGYNYLSNANYAPTSAPTSLALGSGVVITECYNNRLLAGNMQIADGTFTWLSRTYNFYTSGGGGCSPGTGANNRNVMSIADNLQSNRTQSFTYDNLNRISTAQSAVTSGADCWGQSFGYDAWSNLLAENVTKCSGTALSVSVNSQNRITNSGISYDASGNMLTDGINTYTYDGESRISTMNGTAVTYTYDANGQRVHKQVGSNGIDYIHFNGQTIGERQVSGDWSDYVFAGPSLLARADMYEDRIQIWGTDCSNCGTQWYQYAFANAGGLTGYTIQQGDTLEWRQWQDTSTTAGGIDITFTNGGSDSSGLLDQNGVAMGTETNYWAWDYRRVSLSAEVGRSVSQFMLNVSSNTQPGQWNILYQSIILISADGTVHPIYDRGTSVSLSGSGSSGMTGVSYQINHCSCFGAEPEETTTYYHEDQLGSARLMTNYNGYPTWSATFLPFGQEWNAQSTVNHYKFTGYERDAESGNDNAMARYYSSQYGRFLSADPMGGDITNPQSLNRYTYTSNNPANFIDPTGMDPLLITPCIPCDAVLGILDFILLFDKPMPVHLTPPQWSTNDPFDSDVGGTPNVGDLYGCTYGSGSCGGNSAFGEEGGGVITAAGTICLFVPVCGEVEGTVILGGVIIFATGAIIHEGVKDGVIKIPPIFQSRGNPSMGEANAAWREIQRICSSRGVELDRGHRRQWHDKNVTGRGLRGFGELVQAGVDAFCPAAE